MDKDTKEAPKPTPRGVRCVHRVTGQVGYNDADNAYNKHWQRSTGFEPKPLPAKEDLPAVTSEPKANNGGLKAAIQNDESPIPFDDGGKAKAILNESANKSVVASPKGKPGRKPKNT